MRMADQMLRVDMRLWVYVNERIPVVTHKSFIVAQTMIIDIQDRHDFNLIVRGWQFRKKKCLRRWINEAHCIDRSDAELAKRLLRLMHGWISWHSIARWFRATEDCLYTLLDKTLFPYWFTTDHDPQHSYIHTPCPGGWWFYEGFKEALKMYLRFLVSLGVITGICSKRLHVDPPPIHHLSVPVAS